MSRLALLAAFTAALLASSVLAEEPVATLRNMDLKSAPDAPAMTPVSDDDIRPVRNYPEQPPTIPHAIRGYQVDRNGNKCLTCHSRRGAAESQAPMASVTHFMDRDGQVHAFVTARRYFCNQCHVPQHRVKPLVANTFEDADSLIERLSRQRRQ